MANYKATIFFRDTTYNIGWTETWWLSATDPETALTQLANYPTVRKALLMSTSSMVAIRVSNVDHGRDSTYQTTGFPIAGTVNSTTYPIAGVWDCLLCRRDNNLGNTLGHVFLRTVPAGIFLGRDYAPGNISAIGWVAAFAAFVTEVTSGTYFMKDKLSGGGFGYQLCTQFVGMRRTERRLGRPFDALRGRRAVA
jgi:hypothetical protein